MRNFPTLDKDVEKNLNLIETNQKSLSILDILYQPKQ